MKRRIWPANILECCHGAYADGFLWHYLKERVGLPDAALSVLNDFRVYRGNLQQEFDSYQRKEGR